ncbi:hypothetical protein LTR36_000937 [Oleoguttula mirabilis]|uniref:BTB domain-containing protein n=1 Tax=Oleoguttula mirabilis TaxID=1507867 RepID=A0AAV9JPG5_9PEZI|nr:hypothetical protein LTR36_000937 [Oleoguttula mirabilis]
MSLNIDGTMIDVKVGCEDLGFCVHENLIRSHSGFFEAALSKEWAENVERLVKLPEDRPEVFKAYVQWLYSGRIYSINDGNLRNYSLLARMYALGEKLIDPEFQDRVLDAITASARFRHPGIKRGFPSNKAIGIIYDGTPSTSPARRLIVDLHVRYGGPEWMSADCDKVHPEFTLDLATELMKERRTKGTEGRSYEDLESGTPCSYHHHAKGRLCVGQDN